MNRANNAALMDFSTVWNLNGDLIECVACKRALIASRDGEPLKHAHDCVYSERVHPWADLRNALAE